MFKFVHNIWFKRAELVLCCAACLAISILCVLEEPMWLKVLGVIGIVFFGVCGAFALYKNLTGKIGVSIEDNGIYVNGDFIEWKNVTEVEKIQILHEEEMLVVRTNDCEQRIAQAGNMLVRWTLRSNYKRYGGIHLVDDSSVNGTLDAFRDLCLEYKERADKREVNHLKW